LSSVAVMRVTFVLLAVLVADDFLSFVAKVFLPI
jgi:hypothetical protein